jgi:hypothetical protein
LAGRIVGVTAGAVERIGHLGDPSVALVDKRDGPSVGIHRAGEARVAVVIQRQGVALSVGDGGQTKVVGVFEKVGGAVAQSPVEVAVGIA